MKTIPVEIVTDLTEAQHLIATKVIFHLIYSHSLHEFRDKVTFF